MSIHPHIHVPVRAEERPQVGPVSYRTALWNDLRGRRRALRHPLAAILNALRGATGR